MLTGHVADNDTTFSQGYTVEAVVAHAHTYEAVYMVNADGS
jgi:hypothetical protein